MARSIALLRGVNIGPHKRIRMADFRAELETLGYTHVRTYVNSGNAVFTADEGISTANLATEIHDQLVTSRGLDVCVMVRSGKELHRVIDRNPFPDVVATPKLLHVSFLGDLPHLARVAALETAPRGLDEFRVDGTVMYLHYPNGLANATFMPNRLDRALGVATTSRNWTTVSALASLASND